MGAHQRNGSTGVRRTLLSPTNLVVTGRLIVAGDLLFRDQLRKELKRRMTQRPQYIHIRCELPIGAVSTKAPEPRGERGVKSGRDVERCRWVKHALQCLPHPVRLVHRRMPSGDDTSAPVRSALPNGVPLKNDDVSVPLR